MLKFLKALFITGIILIGIGIMGIIGLIFGVILHFLGWGLYVLAFIGFIFLLVYSTMGDDNKNE